MKVILKIILFIMLASKALAFDTKAKYASIIDYDTGEIIFEKSGDDRVTPSSMTKIMTAYIVFDYLSKGNLKLNDHFIHSVNAWKTSGSRMFIPVNKKVSVEDLLKGLIVQSGNDAAVNLAEGIAGSESYFVEIMNEYAKKMNLDNTHFDNASGLPSKTQYSSVNDLNKIALNIIKDFPEYYYIFALKDFTYNNIRQPNRNLLLNTMSDADGLKTGHTDDGGYGLVCSVIRGERRLIATVNGLDTNREASNSCGQLINFGFINFSNIHVLSENKVVTTENVIYGVKKNIDLVSRKKIVLSVHNSFKNDYTYEVHSKSLIAPVDLNEQAGSLVIKNKDGTIYKEFPLYPVKNIARSGVLGKFFYNLKYFVFGIE